MQITTKDLGYTIYSRLEEAFRGFLREKLISFGQEWHNNNIPIGIWNKAQERAINLQKSSETDPADLLEEVDWPDMLEILTFKGKYQAFILSETLSQDVCQKHFASVYDLRNKVAHVKRSFSNVDLSLLIDLAAILLSIVGEHGTELRETLNVMHKDPASIMIKMPAHFLIQDTTEGSCVNNVQELDYNSDGGFVGRREEFKRITAILTSDLDRVITIAGAGGVGKTALAHRICTAFLERVTPPFDAIIWISTKEDRLTLTGIEPIDPMIRSYEEVLDTILEVCGWPEEVLSEIDRKEEVIALILSSGKNGILLVVDNLETIRDERILDFIKDIPRPNKVLITSRMGLGEVERRYALKELSRSDAVLLIRTLSREKNVGSLIKLPDDVLYKYAQKMSCYPLVIKWVIGQVALGKDFDSIVQGVSSASGDIAKFCFEYIYEAILSDDAHTVLCSLAASDTPLTRGILTHVSGLQTEKLDEALRSLVLASLVIPEQRRGEDDTVITIYALLPLTYAYLKARLQAKPDLWRTIQDRMAVIGQQIEEAEKARIQYRYALQDLGATTDEERIAASWASTAHQLFQSGNYVGAVERFKRAIEIAPNFSRVYRNWATVENTAGYYVRANELMAKATQLSPNDPSLWFTWGNMVRRQSRFDQARQHLNKALALSPNDGIILASLAEVEKRRGNFPEADQLFKKALAVAAETFGNKHELITLTSSADNLRRWAEDFHRSKKFPEALSKAREAYYQITKAADMEGSDARVYETKRETALQLGIAISDVEGIETGVPFFNQAILNRPVRFKDKKVTTIACYHAAIRLYNAGRLDEARRYFTIGDRLKFTDKPISSRYDALREKLHKDNSQESA